MKTDLNDLNAFVHVARCGSFRQAAQELQLTPSALSHTLRKLEQALGVRLLNRTTRSVSPTQAGAQLLLRLSPALGEIAQAMEGLNDARQRPAGRVRLNVPRAAAQLRLAPKLAEFRRQYPDIELEIVCNDALVDIVAERFDAGIRFGEQVQQDMIAVRIGAAIHFTVAAAPAYLAAAGEPERPADLLAHQCLQIRFPSGVQYQWEFAQGEQNITVATQGALVSDDLSVLLRAAVDGAGICYCYDEMLAPLVQTGKLQYVLSAWQPAPEYFYLYYPSNRNMPAALRAVIDFFSAKHQR
ncbi:MULTISPECIES: LysR family transcriptional regulator [Deefgea]|uniref:LysR family transcriptional regulator n=1 Tax=Deefgea chitinilytica TaxID=570276 RepID=A0ABS2CAE0_9NEIS|nr:MULTISPECIES: LysR family transcriptional regulator [Deefgea]MBM5571128.1 LysR family transcriptional regulator [Deefgea chitinilytica]MBM9888358.1 LysR family transcriptional regulator [Deefgea sp. CFH1-16]